MLKSYALHYEDSKLIPANADGMFSFVDDPMQFSAHMGESSLMMGGSTMDTSVDEGLGRAVGSHIRMGGKFFGIALFLDEVITRREPPHVKTWETIGAPRLLVIGHYRMGVEIESRGENSLLRVSIDYNMPDSNVWIGKLFGGFYAKWCVDQMIRGTYIHFVKNASVH